MMRRGFAMWRRNGIEQSSCFPCSSSLHHVKKPFKEALPIVGPEHPEIWASVTPLRNHFPSSLPPHQHASNEQTAAIINGKLIAEDIISELADEVSRMKNTIKKVPGLAVILVGQRSDSQSYVRNKIKACEEVGIMSLVAELPDDCSEDEVLGAVLNFNANPSVHGILVQLPLPEVISKTVL